MIKTRKKSEQHHEKREYELNLEHPVPLGAEQINQRRPDKFEIPWDAEKIQKSEPRLPHTHVCEKNKRENLDHHEGKPFGEIGGENPTSRRFFEKFHRFFIT